MIYNLVYISGKNYNIERYFKKMSSDYRCIIPIDDINRSDKSRWNGAICLIIEGQIYHGQTMPVVPLLHLVYKTIASLYRIGRGQFRGRLVDSFGRYRGSRTATSSPIISIVCN